LNETNSHFRNESLTTDSADSHQHRRVALAKVGRAKSSCTVCSAPIISDNSRNRMAARWVWAWSWAWHWCRRRRRSWSWSWTRGQLWSHRRVLEQASRALGSTILAQSDVATFTPTGSPRVADLEVVHSVSAVTNSNDCMIDLTGTGSCNNTIGIQLKLPSIDGN
jgi:hypothetical protein